MKKSAGIILYRVVKGTAEVLLIPSRRPVLDAQKFGRVWSIPKGEINPNEEPLAAAYREFNEETGGVAPVGALALTPLKQRKDKWVYAWAVRGSNAIRARCTASTTSTSTGHRTKRAQADGAGSRNRPTGAATTEALKIHLLAGQSGFIEELFQVLKQRGEIQSFDVQTAVPAG